MKRFGAQAVQSQGIAIRFALYQHGSELRYANDNS